MRYSDNSIRRSDTHRKTVDILKKSGECSLLACHSPVRYYNKSPCRADLYNRRQDIFSFWIEFRRWRSDCSCGTLDRMYLHHGAAEKAQDINSFRAERLNGLQDRIAFCGESRCSAGISLMRYSNSSLYRADLYGRRQDTF